MHNQERNLKGPAIEHMERLDQKLRDAAKKGRAEKMRSLMREGAGPNAADEQGWPPLLFAVASKTAECVALLLPFVDPDRKTQVRSEALMVCIQKGWAEGATLMIDAIGGVLPESKKREAVKFAALRRDRCGMTPLMWAAGKANTECVRLLMPFSKVDAMDIERRTAVMHAATATEGDVAGCLRELLAVSDALSRDRHGRTALHLAAAIGRPDAVERLAGLIDPFDRDAEGKTAFDACKDRSDADGDRIRETLARAFAERERAEINAAAETARVFDGVARRPLTL